MISYTIGSDVLCLGSNSLAALKLLGVNLFNLDFLAFLAFLFVFFRLLVFLLIEGHSSLSHKDSSAFLALILLLLIILLPLLNSQDVLHGVVSAQLRNNHLENVLVLGSVNHEGASGRLVQGVLDAVQEVQLVLFESISEQPLCNHVHLDHMNDALLQLFVILDEVLGSEHTSLSHSKQFSDHCVKGIQQWRQVEVEWLNLPPVLNLKHVQHLANIVWLFLELAVGGENVANSSQFHDELVFEGLLAEVRYLNAISNHFFNVEVVVVCFPQICQGDKGFRLNGAQLLIGLFLVVDVHFVPLLKRFDSVFTP